MLHLGAGALTLARYVAATRPGSPQLAVEVDAALVDLIRLRLPLDAKVRVRVGDARAELERLAAARFDVVIADVFAGGRTPAHLTSAEFWAAARRVLRGTGVFAANVADGAPLAHARAQVATARTAFPQACLIADAARAARPEVRQPGAGGKPRPAPGGRRSPGGRPATRCPARVRHGRDLDALHRGGQTGDRRDRQPLPRRPAGRVRVLAGRFDRGEPNGPG